MGVGTLNQKLLFHGHWQQSISSMIDQKLDKSDFLTQLIDKINSKDAQLSEGHIHMVSMIVTHLAYFRCDAAKENVKLIDDDSLAVICKELGQIQLCWIFVAELLHRQGRAESWSIEGGSLRIQLV